MKLQRPISWLLDFLFIAFAFADFPEAEAGVALRQVDVTACLPDSRDYTQYWHPYNIANPFVDYALKEQLLCIQTGHYGLALDLEKPAIKHLGAVAHANDYADSANEKDLVATKLPDADLLLSVEVAGKIYRCTKGGLGRPDWKRSDIPNYPVRLIESGRIAQRWDCLGLVFEAEDGTVLPEKGRFELVAWPDRLTLVLDLNQYGKDAVAKNPLGENAQLKMELVAGDSKRIAEGKPGEPMISLSWEPGKSAASDAPSVEAKWLTQEGAKPISVIAEDPKLGGSRITLPPMKSQSGTDIHEMQRYIVRVRNTSDKPQHARLFFENDMFNDGKVIGLVPMIRTLGGDPTGIPVQLSKNWHFREDAFSLYQGRWFHGYTVLQIPARSETSFEFTVTYGFWGTLPTASHSQLCLIGWGWNLLWHQVAMGDWSEMICYQPLAPACFVQDIRPLLTWGQDGSKITYTWTANVGGGDFLHYPEAGDALMERPRITYTSQGPNLTDVRYDYSVGLQDNIKAQVRVQTPRTDDIARHYHHFRYDVMQPTSAKGMVFYQTGSTKYSIEVSPRFVSWGNDKGLVDSISVPREAAPLSRIVELQGEQAWVAMTGIEAGSPGDKMPWSPSMGLVMRHFKARLGGKDYSLPAVEIAQTNEKGRSDVEVRLVPPAGVTELAPGDYVEGTVLLLLFPNPAETYTGPNEPLKKALATMGGNWQMIFREARENHTELTMATGKLLENLPPVIQVDHYEKAAFTVKGGLGYLPATFTGLKAITDYEVRIGDGQTNQVRDQSVHGKDFWQTSYDAGSKTWSRTYNLPMDREGGSPVVVEFQRKR